MIRNYILYSLLYLDTITFSQSGSIKRTSSESSEATDIVTLLGLSGGSEQKKKQLFWSSQLQFDVFVNNFGMMLPIQKSLPIFESPFFSCSSKCFLHSHS